MRVPLGWLSEWVDLPASRAELEERLTIGGLEIENVIEMGADLGDIRIGHVVEREPHPNADRLSLCTVDTGDGEPLPIVCGAPNVAAGQRVAVALHGVVLPDGLKIKRSKIRGVVSNGMICSPRELGLGDEHNGILVLPSDAPIGEPLTAVMSGAETVLDVEITPNRGDWVSMLGMAREVCAHFGGEPRMPDMEPAEGARSVEDDVSIDIRDADGCPRYCARVLRGVRVGPSPAWLVERLEAAGLRTVNNVVDTTNLVMLELGQPLHAFDLDKVRGAAVTVRKAEAGEKIATLDGETRELAPEDVVIADTAGAIAVAGVMGGADSEVTAATRNLLLESAQFSPPRVRRTARRLGLHSDASYRFERGVDPQGQARAASRAARVIQQLAGGDVSRGVAVATGALAPPPESIGLSVARVNRLLGTRLEPGDMMALLARVDVDAQPDGREGLLCTPPSWRADLRIPADLAEEIARIHGYDRIDATMPPAACAGSTLPPRRATTEAVRDSLANAGLTEVMTFSGARPEHAEALGLSADDPRLRAVTLQNPIQAGESVLRTTLVPSVLRAGRTNWSRQVDDFALFEVSRVFRARAAGTAEDGLPDEPIEAVVLLAAGSRQDLWEARDIPLFYRAKGVAERLLADLGIAAELQAGSREPYLHPGVSADYRVGDVCVISLGELHPEVAARFEIEADAALLVASVDALDACDRPVPAYREVSRQPRSQRDLAVLLDRDVSAGEVLEAIRKKAGGALAKVEIFDRYEGKGVPEGKVSLAFRMTFQRADRTLTDAEIGKTQERVVQLLAKRFGGELR